jgi:formylglycine-generating enzyme required for sulfatase activity
MRIRALAALLVLAFVVATGCVPFPPFFEFTDEQDSGCNCDDDGDYTVPKQSPPVEKSADAGVPPFDPFPAPDSLPMAPDSGVPSSDTLPSQDTLEADQGPVAHGDAGSLAPKMITVPAQGFMMGSPGSELCRSNDETQHAVLLTTRFEIAATEVTQGAFQALMGYNPAADKACGADCSVESLSWHEAAAYTNALSKAAGLDECYVCQGSGASVLCAVHASYAGPKGSLYDCTGYRLPTEAEWEHAYRAWTYTAYYSGLQQAMSCGGYEPAADAIAWIDDNSGGQVQEVAKKPANIWGIFDMAGNVAEWVNDFYKKELGQVAVTDPTGPIVGNNRVIRGGSFAEDAGAARAAARAYALPGIKGKAIGFRPARSLFIP